MLFCPVLIYFLITALRSDSKSIWNRILPFNPKILTGIPRGNWAIRQKRDWCERELGARVEVITCSAKDKHMHLKRRGDILIDDTERLKQAWESRGGIFILHRDVGQTLSELDRYLE